MPQTPILTKSIVSAGAIAAKRFVTFAGAQVAAAGVAALGVADYEAAAAGLQVAVTVLGTAEVEIGAAVAVGDIIKSDNAGRAIPQGGAGVTIARALTGSTVVGASVEVLLLPAAT